MDDFDTIMAGGKAAPAAPAKARVYDPVDAAIRTVWAENPKASREERVAIASAIRNRADASKRDVGAVVQENDGKTWQFDPWRTPEGRKRIDSLTPDSPEYKSLAADVGGILGGGVPAPTPYTHFYAPASMTPAGQKPDWDDGTGTQVGDHMFFAKPGKGPAEGDAFDVAMGGADAPLTAEEEKAFGDRYGDLSKLPNDPVALVGLDTGKGTANQAQSQTFRILHEAGRYNEKAPDGAIDHPWAMHPGVTEKDVPKGQYYVTEDGKLKLSGGGGKSSFVAGALQGVGDVAASVMGGVEAVDKALNPDGGDSEILTSLKAGKLRYEADHEGDLKSGLGRFTGQLAGAALPLAGAEAVAAPAMAGSAVGRFLLGKGVTTLAPGAGSVAARGASLATKGAIEGAAGAGLVSSANDAPLGEQLATGAGAGAILGPLLPAAARAGKWAGETARDFVQPLTSGGQDKIVNRIIGNFAEGAPVVPDATEIIPGSVPSLAQATANPGIATLERTVRLGRPIPFAEREAANAEARAAVLENARGDEQTVADLVTTRQGVVKRARDAAFASTAPTDPAPLVTALDDALAAPAAHMEEVARPLQAIRDKIVQPPAETTPAQTAAFVRAVSHTFGADAPALTPEVMSAARSKLGSKFEEIAGKTTMKWDDEALSGIVRVISDTAQVVPESSMPPLFKQLANIASTVKNGEAISGASYQALTKKGAPLSTLQGATDPTIRNAANQIREVLDDALERTVAGEPAGKAMLDDLRATRLAYKNLKTVEAALRTAGPDKVVTPAAVLSAVKRNFGQFAYKGGGELGDAAEAALKEQTARGPVVQSDPRQLYGMRESLSGAIEKLEAKGTDSAQLAADHLKGVRDALDATIERGAPGYRSFLGISETSAEPVEATKFLQTLRLTDMKGKVTLSRVDGALKRIADMRAKPGKNPAKSISEPTLAQLEALRADLLRENNINLGRPLGPDTAQHLVTNNIAGNLSTPVALGAALSSHPLVAAAVGAGKLFYGMKNHEVTDKLASRLLKPEALTAGVKPVTRKTLASRIPLGQVLLPAAGAIGANAILGQR